MTVSHWPQWSVVSTELVLVELELVVVVVFVEVVAVVPPDDGKHCE